MAKLTRRNTIIGLGALVGGTGALAASGAFTTVSAERDFTVETAGDASALVSIDVSDSIAGTSSDVISIDVSGLNLSATTTFEDALSVTNNSDNSDVEIDVRNNDGSSLIDSADAVNFVTEESTTLASQGSVNFDLVFDIAATDTSAADTEIDDALGGEDLIVIHAEGSE